MPHKKTLEQFIIESKIVHGDKYDYSKAEYVNTHTKVTLVCPIHGEFKITPYDHINKKAGCSNCYGNKKGNTTTFINKAMNIHGDKYDYSKVEYIRAHTKVTIICPIHGEFSMTPVAHLSQKQGCKICGMATAGIEKRKTLRQFVEEANTVHNNKYAYDNTEYSRNNNKVIIICPEHGNFLQTPTNHLQLKQGCPICANERKGGNGGYSEGWFEYNKAARNIPAVLYVIKMSTEVDKHFIKVGITKKTIKERYSRSGEGDKYISKEIIQIIPTTLYKAFKMEQNILRSLKDHRYFPNYKFAGQTECLKFNDSVIKLIEELID